MPFHDIAGNGRVKSILKLALGRGRVPHALLFCGPRGVGKRATARVLAQALNCLVSPDDACGECDSCRAVVNVNKDKATGEEIIGTHPDVLEYGLMEGAEKVKIDQLRELISLAYLKPMLGKKRVFIVDDVDRASDPAKHTLLKILEEPPLSTQIILITENPELLLPTIRSRCQVLAFLPVSDEEVEKALIDRGVEPEKARIMALVVRGNLERALDLDWDAIEAERREAWTVFKALTLGEDAAAFLRRFAYGRRKDVKEELERMLELLTAFGRDLALLGEGGDSRLLLNPDYEDELRTCAGRTTPEAAMRIVGLLLAAASGLDRNVHLGLLAAALTARWRQAADSM